MDHPQNRKNSVIRAKNIEDVEPVSKSKFSKKLMVWGTTDPQGVSELHVVPTGTKIYVAYFCENILKGAVLPAIQRNNSKGSILTQKMAPDMSKDYLPARWGTMS